MVNKYTYTALTALITAFAVLVISKNGYLNGFTIVSLIIIAGISFVFPLFGLVLSIPILLNVWFKNYKQVLEWLQRLKGGTN